MANVPSPMPKSTETLSFPKFAVTMSMCVSPFRSTSATLYGWSPTGYVTCVANVPSPRPRSTDTVSSLVFAVTMSTCPSPLRSDNATQYGPKPTT